MYLFQPYFPPFNLSFYFYLHSTMYLFQLKCTCSSYRYLLKFTFHHVSISTITRPVSLAAITIYIPPCIYFNRKVLPADAKIDLYLHSTMYLFQLRLCCKYKVLPTYLHSTMYLFQPGRNARMEFLKNIYIPPCIYFNKECCGAQKRFEVNLHSTMYLFQHKMPFLPFCPVLLFTFHHVSISTHEGASEAEPIPQNLHSTMYLFQPVKGVYTAATVSIYIPPCIYFNFLGIANFVLLNLFTFHHVSISTRNARMEFSKNEGNLHSTMYLFQLSHRQQSFLFLSQFTFHHVSISTGKLRAWQHGQKNLHSTMYLFQPAAGSFADTVPFDLHSTMYLFQPDKSTYL